MITDALTIEDQQFFFSRKPASITVEYLDMETMNIVNTQMYIEGCLVEPVIDTSIRHISRVDLQQPY